MKQLSYPDVRQVVVSGDIHEDFEGIVYKLCVLYGLTDTLLIVAGDCGFGGHKEGYYRNLFRRLNRLLAKTRNRIAFVRGNHDDPAYFAKEPFAAGRFQCVPDYAVIRACGHGILCVGGAVSPDRQMRKRELEKGNDTWPWWKDEAPRYDPDSLQENKDTLVDVVVSHTSTSFTGLDRPEAVSAWAKEFDDPGLRDAINQEGETLDNVFHYLRRNGHPLREWYYGHYHQSRVDYIDGVKFIMLDIEEFKEISIPA